MASSLLAASLMGDFDEDSDDGAEEVTPQAAAIIASKAPASKKRAAPADGAAEPAAKRPSRGPEPPSSSAASSSSSSSPSSSSSSSPPSSLSTASDSLGDLTTAGRVLLDKAFLAKVARVRGFESRGAAATGSADSAVAAYGVVMTANALCVVIDEEVQRLHAIVEQAYSQRFPELISHVPGALAYARAVKLVGNTSDMASLDLTQFLTPAQAMAVSMTGSKLTSAPLSERALVAVLGSADAMLALSETKTALLLPFVSSHMPAIAPNLTQLLGADVTAQLLAIVGGLAKLTRIPAGNVQVIGKNAVSLHGFSRAASNRHFGLVHACQLVQKCLPEHRTKAMRTVSNRVALASRLDLAKEDPTGSAGRKWAEEIRRKLEKWHAPAPGKTKKALPVPQTEVKKHRGGWRARAIKAIYGQTEVGKEANRTTFGTGDDEYGDSAMGNTFGRLGKEGSGRLRITETVKKNKRKDDAKLFAHKQSHNVRNRTLLHGDIVEEVAGVSVNEDDGIQLVNPALAHQRRNATAPTKYFGGLGNFGNNKDKDGN